MFETLEQRGFQIAFQSHASAIMRIDFPELVVELGAALGGLSIPVEEIIGSGGGEAKGTQRLRRALAAAGWNKVKFTIEKTLNGNPRESISHEVDHVRIHPSGLVALEIEWNNKDPFFDRDLENFKRLHAEGAISIGIIITRGLTLQRDMTAMVRRFAHDAGLSSVEDLRSLGLNPTVRQQRDVERRVKAGAVFAEAWSQSFVQDKFGSSTTHWRKLEDRIQRGVGNPCPLLLIGLPSSVVTFGEALDLPGIVAGDDDLIV